MANIYTTSLILHINCSVVIAAFSEIQWPIQEPKVSLSNKKLLHILRLWFNPLLSCNTYVTVTDDVWAYYFKTFEVNIKYLFHATRTNTYNFILWILIRTQQGILFCNNNAIFVVYSQLRAKFSFHIIVYKNPGPLLWVSRNFVITLLLEVRKLWTILE